MAHGGDHGGFRVGGLGILDEVTQGGLLVGATGISRLTGSRD